MCAHSLFCNFAMHARCTASESNPADAPCRQNGLMLARLEPGETRPATKSRIHDGSGAPRHGNHETLCPFKVHPREAAFYRKTKLCREATFLCYAKSISTFMTWRPSTAPFQLPGDCHWTSSTTHSYRGTGSDMGASLLSAIKSYEHRLGRNGEQTLPR